MKRRFTILTAALALLVSLAIPMGMRGQTKTEGFETATASTTYNSTVNLTTQQSDCGIAWTIYYGCVSTNNKISGNKSAQMRWYSSATSNRPYLQSTTAIDGLTNVAFKARVGNTNVKMDVHYSSDGNNWTAVATAVTFTAANTAYDYSYTIPSGGKYIKIGVSSSSTAPSSGNYAFIVDDVVFTYSSSVNTYTVTYHANGGTGTMTDSNSPYTAGATVTVMDNTFTRDNYTFDHWNTSADDSGTDYDEGDTFTINANTTLYAQWTENGGGTGGDGTLTFDFEDDGAHRASGNNSYSNNSYEENGVDIDMTYFDAIQNSAIGGSYLARGRVAKNTTNSPVMIIGPIDITDKTITGITFKTEGPITITEAFATSTDGTNYTNHLTFALTSTSTVEQKTVSNLEITGSELYLKWSGSVSSSTSSNRDFDVDDVVVTYIEASNPAVATTTTINVPSDFNTDIYQGTTAGTLTATVKDNDDNVLSGATVTWSSSNTGIATIDANGVVTLVAVGTTTITANYAGVEDQYRPSTGTYELTVTSSEPIPGTQAMPYTVAQARAAIDAGTGTQGVYATGIVSQVDSYNNNYHSITYWISDDGTTTNQLEAYGGISGITGWTFASKDDIEVGATVVIYGNLKKYNSTYEFDVNNELVSYTAPVHAVEAPTFSPVAGTYTEAQNVTISCTTTGANIYYTTDGTEPTNASTEYTSALTISSTTTVKAIAYVGTDASTVATATYHFCSAEDPYTVTEALAFNEYPANGIYVHGIVSTAPTSLSSGTLTYYISDDGTTATQLEVYKGKDLNNEAFTAADDIQVGDIVTIYGNVVIYNGTKEFSSGNYLVSFERPTTPAQEYSLTVSSLSHVNLFIFGGEESETIISTEDGETTAQVYNGTEVTVSIDVEEGYVFQSLTITDANGNPVEMEELTANEYYGFTMPASNVTITATAIVAPAATTYSLATSIESGKQYIIVGKGNSKYYAMSYNKGTNRHAVEITSDGATATVAIDNTQTNAHEFTITSLATTGYYTIQDATASGYLYAGSDSGNQLKTYDESDLDVNGEWHITINAETGVASVVADKSSNRNVMQFNAGSSSSNNQLFNCYASASQHEVYLYVKDETPVTETYQLDVPGYAAGSAGGYRLIASPVTVKPADVQGMILTGDDAVKYDLFYFDQSNTNEGAYLEWVNYKSGNHHGFNLIPGKGYLYAQQATTEGEVFYFTLSGSPYTGNGIIPLDYDASARFAGWNLIGNPYATAATLDKPFYKMDANGVGLGAQIEDLTNTIAAMEGVFVQVNATGQSAKFTPQRQSNQPASIAYANIVVNDKKGSVLDNAIVRFDNGETLGKFQLNRNSTKVYFSENNNDYAIVRGEEMGAMPVSFKAENNGTYTLNVSGQNTEFAYLHLIDNKTGNEVDLLQTPSYSFEAKTTDYESRFKLVFATGDNSNDDTFAFYSNGSFVINNEGNAELQVIDIMGRIVKSESVNGCANVNVNAAPGVYMLRLVNGTDVKTQKVVVK